MGKTNLNQAMEGVEKELKAEMVATRKAFKAEIETAIAQLVDAFGKALEGVATRDDLKRLESRLEGVESRLDRMEGDLRDAKRGIGDLKADAPTARELRNHEHRISRLESRAFPS